MRLAEGHVMSTTMIGLAIEAIDSGAARDVLDRLVARSRELSGAS